MHTFSNLTAHRAGCTNAQLTIWLTNRGLTLNCSVNSMARCKKRS